MSIVADFHEVKKLKDEMFQQVYSELFDALEEDERYFDLDLKDLLNMPRQFENDAIVLPTAREVVLTAVNHINPRFRSITVPRRTITPKGTEQAQTLKKFYAALLTWLERQPSTSPFHDAVTHLTLYGRAGFKLLYDRTKHPDRPRREQFSDDEDFEEAMAEWQATKAENLPFTLLLPHPSAIMEDPWHDPPEWVIEHGKMRVGQVQSVYPSWDNPNNKKLSDVVHTIEFWDDKVRSVVVDGHPALKSRDGSGIVRHKWLMHPYIIGASGLGYDDKEHKPEKRFIGMLRYIRDLLLSESRSFSIADIVLKAGAWPVRVATGDRANDVPDLKLEYGTVQPMPPGVSIDTLTPDLPPDMLFNHQQQTNGIISAATAPRVVRGQSMRNVRSGFDRQLALGEARLQYDPLAQAINTMLTQLCIKAGIYVERLTKGQLSLVPGTESDEFVTVSPSTFKNHHAVSVEVNVLQPEDDVRKNQDAAAMVAANIWSPQTAIRKRFPDLDPNTELGRSLAFRLMFSEPMLNLIGASANQTVAENLGLEQVLEQVMAQIQGASQEISAQSRSPRQGESAPAEEGAGSRSDQAQMRGLDMRETGF